MSHGDRVTVLPPGFRAVGDLAERADRGDRGREAQVLRRRNSILRSCTRRTARRSSRNFVRKIVGLRAATGPCARSSDEAIEKIRKQVGKGRVICGLSGGVNSAVAAVLIHEAIGEQLTCVFVDHGLLRLGEAEQVVTLFRDSYNIPLVHVDAEA